MHIKVDQSIRVEQPADTVLAFSDTTDYAILIPRAAKRTVAKFLREIRGKDPETAAILIFSASVFLLVKDILRQVESIEIDEEYTGKEAAIKGIVLRLIRRVQPGFPKSKIRFGRIGRKAGAHTRAIAITRGRDKPDRIVTEAELLSLLK